MASYDPLKIMQEKGVLGKKHRKTKQKPVVFQINLQSVYLTQTITNSFKKVKTTTNDPQATGKEIDYRRY